MDHYHIWIDLRPGIRDLAFASAVRAYFEHLQKAGLIEGASLTRRKLGFGPDGLGDWHMDIRTRDLHQLETCFQDVAARSGETERLHAAVYSSVTNFKAALYRDFPDTVRVTAGQD